MPHPITRRDFLNATLLASGAVLAEGASPLQLLAARGEAGSFDGPGGIGDYAGAHGDLWAEMVEGHRIRDRSYERVRPRDVAEAGTFDCVVIGGGISGLAAALFFARKAGPGRTCLVLEDHSVFGGLARRNEFEVGGHHLVAPQAWAMFFPPLAGTFLADFYPSIGIEANTFEYQKWAGPKRELPVGPTPYFAGGPTSAFYFGPEFGQRPGRLVIDPLGSRLADAPISDEARRDLLAMNDATGPRTMPREHGDAESRRLDGITLEEDLMQRFALRRETVRRFLSPVAGGGSGIGADVLSAYADYAADVLLPWDYGKGVQMFPGGNTGVARHIVKSLLPDALPGPNTRESVSRARVRVRELDRAGRPTRIRTGATVVSVTHRGGKPESSDQVEVVYSRGGRLHRVKARAVIAAGGSWTTRHVVKDLPPTHQAAYAQFHRSPCLVASVAVRHWRFLHDRGIHECRWFEGIGSYLAVRKVATFGEVAPTISPDTPVVLTLKILFSHPGEPLAAQVMRGRAELLSTPYREYERRIREQLTAMFGPGFDAARDMAGLVLNRWGHAYLSAQPGFFFGKDGQPAPGEVLRAHPVGRVAFANSDLAGIMDHRASILEADRAVRQVLERL
jgi:spermidine dehydrogenase